MTETLNALARMMLAVGDSLQAARTAYQNGATDVPLLLSVVRAECERLRFHAESALAGIARQLNEAAARSAAESLRIHAQHLRHAEAVSECPHCNARFLAQWVLDVLGPEAPQPAPPGPADPPRRAKPSQWTDHPEAAAGITSPSQSKQEQP